jgi:hypothetical protein
MLLLAWLLSTCSCSYHTPSSAASDGDSAVTAGQPLYPSCLLYLLPCTRLYACLRRLLPRVLCPLLQLLPPHLLFCCCCCCCFCEATLGPSCSL